MFKYCVYKKYLNDINKVKKLFKGDTYMIIVGSVADNSFVGDISQHMNQKIHYSDLISLKSFLNNEFCPRFIVDEESIENIGSKLKDQIILIVSSNYYMHSRDELAMRNFLIARAAKDNGAKKVILLEPDLFYSAQDRGPRKEHGKTDFERTSIDYKKFDGQPFSSKLYADLLNKSGIDEVITVHNHSNSVKNLFKDIFDNFYNLQPSDIYASYIKDSDIVDENNMILCAPDKGALKFVNEVHDELKMKSLPIITMEKERLDERKVRMILNKEKSDLKLSDVAGKEVVVLDDMVRTGNTITRCCKMLKEAGAKRIVFFVTHFYSSREGRVNLNDDSIDEIVTTSTIPEILNRDIQGRLRHKIVVLRIARWISNFIMNKYNNKELPLDGPYYSADISSKNPRWKKEMKNNMF